MTAEELIRRSEEIQAKAAEIRRRNAWRDQQIKQQLAEIDRTMQKLLAKMTNKPDLYL